MKCHRCGEVVVKGWWRGVLVFCSERCRNHSLNEGEPCDEGSWPLLGDGERVFVHSEKVKG